MTPDRNADDYAGRRPFLRFDSADEFNADIVRIRARGTVHVFWRDGGEGYDYGWTYTTTDDAEPWGPFETSRDAYECAIGW